MAAAKKMGSKQDSQRKPPRMRKEEQVPTEYFTPRTYQVELLDTSIKKNTIVCLGTGTGKTFIAVLLIKELAHQIRQPFQDGGKRTFFLVDSVPLVSQQAKVIRIHTDLAVGEYVGAMDVDLWSKERWTNEFTNNQVLVMTVQIFLDIVLHGFLPLNQVNLLIFDECHHAVKNHPYVQIMKCFDTCNPGNQPRILGLTASILNSRCRSPDELKKKVTQLENTLKSTAETASDMISVESFGAKPQEFMIECDQYDDVTGLIREIDTILTSTLSFLADCNIPFNPEDNEKDPCAIPKTVLQECQAILHHLGPWCADRIAQACVKQLDKFIEHEYIDLNRHFLRLAQTQLRMIHAIFDQKFNDVMCLEDFLQFVSPKVIKFLEVLHEYKPNDDFMIIGGENYEDFVDSDGQMSDDSFDSSDDESPKLHRLARDGQRGPVVHYVAINRQHSQLQSDDGSSKNTKDDNSLCGLVFVERRYAAFALHKLVEELCNWDENLFFIKSSHITGSSTGGKGQTAKGKDSEVAYKRQEEVLRKFRFHEVNLLIATSVVEEGVDIPKCNLVVRFDLPNNYRSYVQSKGRARATNSKFVMLVEYGEIETFKEDLQTFKGIEKILLGKCREHDLEEDDLENVEVDDMMEPYMPLKEDGAPRVTMSSAIGLVNRYCAKLPSDSFTHLSPKCHITQVPSDTPSHCNYICSLQLPINSPVKEPIQGDPMPKKKLAKMAVALKACKILHEAGELDDHLLPVGKEVLRYDDEDNEWDNEDIQGQAQPGTTKRKQYYYKKVAAALVCPQPQPNQSCYLYLVDMKLTCPITEEQNTRGRKIYDPRQDKRFFGILTRKEIPKVPKYPVFTRSGEVTVSLQLIIPNLSLTEDEIKELPSFHQYVFTKVLRLRRDPMIFNPAEATSSMLIVPLDLDAINTPTKGIDWEFIGKIQTSTPRIKREELFGPGRHTFVFKDEDFIDAVVMPAYRNIDQPQFFYVAEIRHDLNPKSAFPSPELFQSFEEYYSKKYALELTSITQPLLDVDHTSARLNLLTPRYVNQKGVALPTSSAETKRARRENLQQKQILIPELCDIHPFPASLWRKAVCLPAILYRLNYLLISEELRILISTEAHIGKPDLPEGFEFPTLDFGLRNKRETPEKDSEMSKIVTGVKDMSVTDTSPNGEDHLCNGISEETSLQENENDSVKNAQSTRSIEAESMATVGREGDDDIGINCDTDADIISNKSAMKTENNEDCKFIEQEKAQGSKQLTMQETIKISENGGLAGPMTHDGISAGHITNDNVQITTSGIPVDNVSFDTDIDLENYIGPSPCIIIQALTMSNANDFFNLERLETIGDSFLKFAITIYLYCTYPGIHEGKLSYLRSKQVSNFNLYRLGKKKGFAECMIATKFEPNENWLPPGYVTKTDPKSGLKIKISSFDEQKSRNKENANPEQNLQDRQTVTEEEQNFTEYKQKLTEEKQNFPEDVSNIKDVAQPSIFNQELETSELVQQQHKFNQELEALSKANEEPDDIEPNDVCVIPYDLRTQHSLPDKSIADCVEAVIGCYLTQCGPTAALQFMSWVGLKVLPETEDNGTLVGGQKDPMKSASSSFKFNSLPPPASPLLPHVKDADKIVHHYYIQTGFESFEKHINYTFKDKSYLLQAFTHASYHYNTVTDCYQRLEFLGDAILDYVITRHLFEDKAKHSPGVLTDLRSALVNNNIFAALAVKWEFHKYFKAVSPQLFSVINAFVEWQKEKKDEIDIDHEFFNTNEDEDEEGEDIEIPKALGDIFESVAGAIYLDSGMSLDQVWKVYYRLMKPQIDQFTSNIPKSPVRELLEMEPETAKFEKPDRTMDGKIRVTVNVVGKGQFRGIGRNYRIAKSAAAKRALKCIRLMKEQQQLMILKQMAMLGGALPIQE